MTRKEALIALRDAVQAGMWQPVAAAAVFWLDPADCTENRENAENAYYGSLDAAKALHEAVLPGPIPEFIHSDARKELLRTLEALISEAEE